MKRKNKKLIVFLSVLLLGIGVSFAYFIAGVIFSGNGSTSTGTTATINGATITTTGVLEFNERDLFPGRTSVSAIKLVATGDNEFVSYNVVWTGTNTLDTPLNFKVYKSNTNIDVEATCDKVTKVVDGAQHLSEECTISNIDKLGSIIGEGSIPLSTEETKSILLEDEFITAYPSGEELYYYVVIEYPNLDSPQEPGGSFSATVNVEKSDAVPDINIVAVYLQDKNNEEKYNQVNDIPQEGYDLNTSKSTCTNGATPSWDYSKKGLFTSNLTKSGTSCYLYFDALTTMNELLANKNISTRTDFTTTYTADSTGTLFTAEDDDGTSYYYAGAPTDNYVKFANKYWRIIRINGDGSIRMIYAGDVTTIDALANKATVLANGYNDANTDYSQTETSTFNSSSNNMYVGFMYTSGQVHGLGSPSAIKGKLDTWYGNNLATFADKIDTNAGFCGDRTPHTNNTGTSGGGTGTTTTYYGAYIRLYKSNSVSNAAPSFKCNDKTNDLYTVGTSSKGNKALTNPIGLITADEVAYAGAIVGTGNSSYYLYTGNVYWTISPSNFGSSNAYVFNVNISGQLHYNIVNNTNGVRPVINLKSGTWFEPDGDGTIEKPYVVM